MIWACPSPDPASGVAVLLSTYLDCQARALGENGFQALAGGPMGMGILSGLLTIFIGIIGYRLILGEAPGVRDGIGWAARVGMVLALVTSWPVFQTLVFRVVTDGPIELAGVLLPSTGLSAEGMEGRIQQAYDAMRIGTSLQQGTAPAAQQLPFQPAMPQTASVFVLSTAAFTGAFRIAIGFLLAVGPLAIMCLLFEATLGIFVGWIRALAGLAFATVAAMIVTAIDLTIVEGQLAHLQAFRFAGAGAWAIDQQGLPTVVLSFAVIMLITTFAAMRMTNAFRLWGPRPPGIFEFARQPALVPKTLASIPQATSDHISTQSRATVTQSRAAGMADALAASARREQAYLTNGHAAIGTTRDQRVEIRSRDSTAGSQTGLGAKGRRAIGRRTRSATRRDKIA